ncbi:MAG: hypothetical protein U1F98_07105 [Verrucomicrobiota bacterium]
MQTAASRTSGREATEALRKSLLFLVDNCPVEKCNPDDCPLHSLRLLKRADRIRWFEALSGDDLSFLAAYHYVCRDLKAAG